MPKILDREVVLRALPRFVLCDRNFIRVVSERKLRHASTRADSYPQRGLQGSDSARIENPGRGKNQSTLLLD